jgi:hypothetical protein
MLVKHNNNSISDLTSAGQLAQGKMTLISSQTASGSASIEFTSGIDSSYPIYRFEFININPDNDNQRLEFNFSTDGGSNYNVTKTTTFVETYHNEADTDTILQYNTGGDLAQSTSFKRLMGNVGNGADESYSGVLQIFNPSSTTFVKHFIADGNSYHGANYSARWLIAGYGNTTSSINAIKFQMASGNFDGTIKLYGIKGD